MFGVGAGGYAPVAATFQKLFSSMVDIYFFVEGSRYVSLKPVFFQLLLFLNYYHYLAMINLFKAFIFIAS